MKYASVWMSMAELCTRASNFLKVNPTTAKVSILVVIIVIICAYCSCVAKNGRTLYRGINLNVPRVNLPAARVNIFHCNHCDEV